jgi:hypothetical protein
MNSDRHNLNYKIEDLVKMSVEFTSYRVYMKML